MAVRMNDGTEEEIGPGDVVKIEPGHDAWVVGDKALQGGRLRGHGDVREKGLAKKPTSPTLQPGSWLSRWAVETVANLVHRGSRPKSGHHPLIAEREALELDLQRSYGVNPACEAGFAPPPI